MIKKRIIILSALFFFTSGMCYFFFVNLRQKIADPNVNQIFQMRDIYNSPVGKLETDFVIINFWASWCPPCVQETPSLIRFTQKYSKYFTLLALSQDTTKNEIYSFVKIFPALKSTYITIIHDDSQSVARSFKVKKLPETFIYSIKQNKHFQLSGATNWDQPELVQAIERNFNLQF